MHRALSRSPTLPCKLQPPCHSGPPPPRRPHRHTTPGHSSLHCGPCPGRAWPSLAPCGVRAACPCPRPWPVALPPPHRVDVEAQARELAQVALARLGRVVGHKHELLALQASGAGPGGAATGQEQQQSVRDPRAIAVSHDAPASPNLRRVAGSPCGGGGTCPARLHEQTAREAAIPGPSCPCSAGGRHDAYETRKQP